MKGEEIERGGGAGIMMGQGEGAKFTVGIEHSAEKGGNTGAKVKKRKEYRRGGKKRELIDHNPEWVN